LQSRAALLAREIVGEARTIDDLNEMVQPHHRAGDFADSGVECPPIVDYAHDSGRLSRASRIPNRKDETEQAPAVSDPCSWGRLPWSGRGTSVNWVVCVLLVVAQSPTASFDDEPGGFQALIRSERFVNPGVLTTEEHGLPIVAIEAESLVALQGALRCATLPVPASAGRTPPPT